VVIISYVALYSVSQFLLDFLRQSEPVTWLGLKELQLTAIVSLVVLVPVLTVIWRRTEGRTGQAPAALAEAAGSAMNPERPADPEKAATS
jgi:prolipoprotein diacylglyceryltransferase